MRNKDFSYIYKNWDDEVRRRKVFLSNPVFIKGLALAPLAVAATTLENGIILSIMVILLLTPTRVVCGLITKRMSVPFKTFFYPLVSAVIFCFMYYYMYKHIGSKVLLLGAYLPILVVDPLIVKNFEKTRKESFLYSIINGVRNTAGFVVACLLISAIREFLAYGSLLGYVLSDYPILPMLKNPFGGFMVIALLSGMWTKLVEKYRYTIEVEAKHNERNTKADN